MNSDRSIEQKLLVEAIYLKYGYDFRHYAQASFTRRVDQVVVKMEAQDLLDLLRKVLESEDYFRRVLSYLTVSTTELFRDPEVFEQIRAQLVPVLKTYPRLHIWIAGCSTGEEVYSLAILLKEEGLLHRSLIYATDINPKSLSAARTGIYPLQSMQSFVQNYTKAGGEHSPSEYYQAEGEFAVMNSDLRENVIFDEHNLATDHVFKEMHLILCRNVLIYFDRKLQDRVFRLFRQSLVHKGFLILGSKETTKFSSSKNDFKAIDWTNRIFQIVDEAEQFAPEVS